MHIRRSEVYAELNRNIHFLREIGMEFFQTATKTKQTWTEAADLIKYEVKILNLSS